MTNDEWTSKSDDWRKGWRYGQGDVFVHQKNTPDFIDGYKYAIEHPEGSCYSADATTGKGKAVKWNERIHRTSHSARNN